MKKTLVLGASPNPERYSYKAVAMLRAHGHEVIAIGLRVGTIKDLNIVKGTPTITNLHTITLYLRADLQKPLYEYMLSLHPKRIIFNPGAENPELEQLAQNKGIETCEACTLVMLSIGNY
jgi:predicted CoA-binding protein